METERMDGILAHTRTVAEDARPDRWLYLLHGIYGSGRNWGSFARRLVEEQPGWGVVLVDLRLHGDSTDFSPPHTVRSCADDVARLEAAIGLPASGILGHSFGGKVALVRAADIAGSPAHHPPGEGRDKASSEEELQQIWVADSNLRTGEPRGSAWRVIEIVRGLPERFESREQLADALVENGYERGMGMWLAMNLEREADSFRWKLDWDGVEEMLRDYFRTDIWKTVENPPGDAEVHVVKAAKSDTIDEESADRITAAGERNGRVFLHTVEAGHWLNVDNPEAVLRLLAERL